jgi:Flp pilus assembly protein TadG
LFLVVMWAVFYFGFMLYSRMSVINAAREGAHYAIVLDPTNTQFTTLVATQVNGAAQAGGLNTAAVSATTSGFKVANGVVSATACTWGSAGGCVAGDAVNVVVNYQFANPVPLRIQLLGAVVINIPSSITLSSNVLMIHE